MRYLVSATVLILLLTGCGDGGDNSAAPVAEVTVTETVTIPAAPAETVTVTSEPEPEPTQAVDPNAGLFPKGYPKRIAVSDIGDDLLESNFEDYEAVVGVAPGVYAILPPGATVMDAALGDVYDGYCASIDAYSRKFRDGEEFGGSCF